MASGTGLSYMTNPTPSSASSILGHSLLPHGAGGATSVYESKGGYPEYTSTPLSQKSIHKKPKSKGKPSQKHKGGSKKKSKTKKHQRRTRAR
jgi:hypothetical protein